MKFRGGIPNKFHGINYGRIFGTIPGIICGVIVKGLLLKMTESISEKMP